MIVQTPWKVIRIYLLIWLVMLIVLLVASIIRYWEPIRTSLLGSVSQLITAGIAIAILVFLLITLLRGR